MSAQQDEKKVSTILYIEDDPSSRRLVQRVLEGAGYRVLLASNGLDGIALAQRERPSLILMDINMPNFSGDMVATRMRITPGLEHTPIIAVTALTQPGYRERALIAGCDGYIPKPIDIDALPCQVEEYLGGRRDEVKSEEAGRYYTEYSQALVRRLETKIRELEEANRELRLLDKMKGDFITLTSHELRTPFTLVYGYSRLLQDAIEGATNTDTELVDLASSLISAVDRLGEVLNEILDLARIASGKISPALIPLELHRVVEQAIAKVRVVASDREVAIDLLGDDWPQVWADPIELQVAFGNILGNALKYTPDGGRVTISAARHGEYVEVAITDTGIGIDPDEQQFIFETFYTSGNTEFHTTSKTAFKGGGLGLGLAIAKRVIEAHKGRIWVESLGRDEDRCPGSTFHVLLSLDPRQADDGQAKT